MSVFGRALALVPVVAIFAPLAEAAVSPSPGIFEVDLLFPRNDTYDPVALMPIVFGVQNPALAVPLSAQISWNIYPAGNPTLAGNPYDPGAYIYLDQLNSSTSDPYLATSMITSVYGIEKSWVFEWFLSTSNCTKHGYWRSVEGEHNSIIFTTRSGAQQPDLVAATASNTCASTEGFAFNVTGFVPAYKNHTSWASMDPWCAHVPPTSTPTPKPCAATIGSAAASSISVAATAAACVPTVAPNHVACPNATTTNSTSAAVLSYRPAIQSAVGLLTFLTGLIML